MKTPALLFIALAAMPLIAAESARPAQPASPPAAKPEKPEKPTGDKASQLAAAKYELVVMRMRRDEKHPVILKQRRKIAELQREIREEEAKKPAPDRATELASAKRELAQLREQYTDQHPVVRRLVQRIAELEAR